MSSSPVWCELEEDDCPCQGSGWAYCDSWQECPIHFRGQLHPESRSLLLDDPVTLSQEERKSFLRWQIEQSRVKINTLKQQLRQEEAAFNAMELELVKRTPTLKMEVISMLQPNTVIEITGEDFI